jgi:hypothetical protein
MPNKPLTTDPKREFDRIATYGSNLEAIGKALQDPDTTVSQLVDLAVAAGHRLAFQFHQLTPIEPE